MARTRGFTHIHLFVRDIRASLRFYQSLGLLERFRDGPKMVFLNTPGTDDLVTLHEKIDESVRAGDSGGVWHFGFLVEPTAIEELVNDAIAAGGKLIERGQRGTHSPFAAVSDPDGYAVELYTPERPFTAPMRG